MAFPFQSCFKSMIIFKLVYRRGILNFTLQTIWYIFKETQINSSQHYWGTDLVFKSLCFVYVFSLLLFVCIFIFSTCNINFCHVSLPYWLLLNLCDNHKHLFFSILLPLVLIFLIIYSHYYLYGCSNFFTQTLLHLLNRNCTS